MTDIAGYVQKLVTVKLASDNLAREDVRFLINNTKYFLKAKQVAEISDYNGTHVGCVAVYKGKVIGIGCNTEKTHPSQKYYNRFRESKDDVFINHKLHAEINCLNQLKHTEINYSKIKLYIYRIRKDKQFGMSRPCPSCMAAIKDMGIRTIYYTTDDGYACEKIIPSCHLKAVS